MGVRRGNLGVWSKRGFWWLEDPGGSHRSGWESSPTVRGGKEESCVVKVNVESLRGEWSATWHLEVRL